MSAEPVNLFFLGKGGVGKSTSAALAALEHAAAGKSVLLVSLDPAHNLSDIFEQPLTGAPTELGDNLFVAQADLKFWIRRYLQEVQAQIKKSYSYLSALNLESYLDTIKFSPGIEEYALLQAFNGMRRQYAEMDLLIFDMPPTALTLKFFGLPHLSLVWLEKLLALRQEILKKREIITKIQFGRKEFERDKILQNLQQQIEMYRAAKRVFEDRDRTRLCLVLNPDRLSLRESQLIRDTLREFNLDFQQIMVNKYREGDDLGELEQAFPEYVLELQPFSATPLIGHAALAKYVADIR